MLRQATRLPGAHGITPKRLQKKSKKTIDGVHSAAAQETMLRDNGLLEETAKNLEFEKAAQVRDQLHVLKQQAFGRREAGGGQCGVDAGQVIPASVSCIGVACGPLFIACGNVN